MFDFDFGLGGDIELLRETVGSFVATEIAAGKIIRVESSWYLAS